MTALQADTNIGLATLLALAQAHKHWACNTACTSTTSQLAHNISTISFDLSRPTALEASIALSVLSSTFICAQPYVRTNSPSGCTGLLDKLIISSLSFIPQATSGP